MGGDEENRLSCLEGMTRFEGEHVECHVEEARYSLALVEQGGKVHVMARKKTELVLKTLERMVKKVQATEKAVVYTSDGVVLDETKANCEVWEQVAQIRLPRRGRPDTLPVVLNPPKIVSTELSCDASYVGVPLAAGIEFAEGQTAENTSVAHEWIVDGKVVCTERVFTPTEVSQAPVELRLTPYSVGRKLLGRSVVCRTRDPVKRFVESVYRKTEDWGACDADGLRIGTYNVLADCYAAGTEHGRDVLYPYVPADVLHMDYRLNCIIRDIVEMGCDFVSLQEVGHSFFRRISYVLEAALGYSGWHSLKMGSGTEGCAVFWREARFEMLERVALPLGGKLEDIPFAPAVRRIVVGNNELSRIFSKNVVSIAQFMVVRDRHTGWVFTHANTHLYYHPDGNIVRALQLHTIFHQAEARGLSGQFILTGDLNTTAHEYHCHPKEDLETYTLRPVCVAGEPVAPVPAGDERTLPVRPRVVFARDGKNLTVDGVAVTQLAYDMKACVLSCGGKKWRLPVSDDRVQINCLLGVLQGCEGVDLDAFETVVPLPASKRLIQGETLADDDRDWGFTDDRATGDDANRVRMKLSLPFDLEDPNKDLPYTSHTQLFTAVLDYTLYSPGFFAPSRLMPRIDFDLVRETLPGWPTEDHPSDHIPVFLDFKYIGEPTGKGA